MMRDDVLAEVLDKLAVRRRDDAAWDVLYRGMWPLCVATAFRVLAARDLAEDAASETMLRTLEQYKFEDRRGPEHFRNWIRTVARNAAIDIFRRNERADRGRDDVDLGHISGGALPNERAEARQTIENALNESSLLDRDILLLVADGHSLQEVAEKLGLTPENVGVRIHRARARLRRKRRDV